MNIEPNVGIDLKRILPKWIVCNIITFKYRIFHAFNLIMPEINQWKGLLKV